MASMSHMKLELHSLATLSYWLQSPVLRGGLIYSGYYFLLYKGHTASCIGTERKNLKVQNGPRDPATATLFFAHQALHQASTLHFMSHTSSPFLLLQATLSKAVESHPSMQTVTARLRPPPPRSQSSSIFQDNTAFHALE